METQKKMKAGEEEDRLSDLPDPMLIHILSMLQNGKEVLRTSVLSKRWRFLWKSVPISLDFYFPEDDPYFGLPVSGEKEALDFVASTHRELHYWSHCATKIKKFNLMVNFSRSDRFAKDVDFWVYFATKIANVEDFTLDCISGYEFPKFAYNNASLKNLAIQYCELDPSVSVNWSSLVSLSIGQTDLTGNFMEKVLSGCPNLESLQLEFFRGFHSLEISNVKLRKLTITGFDSDERDVWLEILAPCIQELQLLGSSCGIRLKNVASLVTAVLYLDLELDFGVEEKTEKKELSCLKELLHSVAHVKNLELGPWFVKCISTLALEGWQSQPSSSKFLKLHTNFEELDFPGISSFLQSSPHLETLVIDWRPYLFPRYVKDKERKIRRFETHKFNCALLHLSLLHLPLLHLKTIKFINLDGPLSENKFVLPLVKYFLENAIVLEKFDMAARCKGSAVPVDEIKIEQELLSFPRSSLRASLVFSDQ